MPERWVNAVVEITIPLDVPVDALPTEKIDAAVAKVEELDIYSEEGYTVGWEDVEDGTPLKPDAQRRLDSLIKGLEGEVEQALAKSKRNAALVHWEYADRLSKLIEEARNG
jgi:hypothetical protein